MDCHVHFVANYFNVSIAGKTNHGQNLFGRVMRHKDVNMCPVGALAFYLAMRFYRTNEFDSWTGDNFMENRSWFDKKLLVDCTRSDTDLDRSMHNNSYKKAIKSVLEELNVPSNHFVHLGRTLGPKLMEMLQMSSDEIRLLGNWEPKIQETSYSTKLPMKAIRAMGGFELAQGMHYNPRTVVVDGLEILKKKTPFSWVTTCLAGVETAALEGTCKYTALCFLKIMDDLNTVLIQDAAAMIIKFPERKNHPLFNIPVFKTPEFKVRNENPPKCSFFDILIF